MKDFCFICILYGLAFLARSFNLMNFYRNWFLIEIDFCKPDVIQGLSLNFIFIEIFSDVHKCWSKIQTFQGNLYIIYQCSCLMQAKAYPSQPKNNPEQNFFGQILVNHFHIYWIWDRKNWKKYYELQEVVEGGLI